MIRRILLIAALSMVLPLPTLAAGGGGAMYNFLPDLGNRASLQRGAKHYMNYCSGCHSLEYMRYNRIAEDLDIPIELVEENLMFTTDNVGDTITIARREQDAASWFGAPPPDLSTKVRHRGASWVYSFLMTFYLDETKATGVNNPTLEGTSMPHVLGHLQGWQRPIYEEVVVETKVDEEGNEIEVTKDVLRDFRIVEEGSMNEEEYEVLVADLVNFLTYASEPARLQRFGVGIGALFFLSIFTTLAYLLKREYWKDVH